MQSLLSKTITMQTLLISVRNICFMLLNILLVISKMILNFASDIQVSEGITIPDLEETTLYNITIEPVAINDIPGVQVCEIIDKLTNKTSDNK